MRPQAVILAAGEGSRLRQNGDAPPKPLTLVGGISLLERAVRNCEAAGASEVLVVVGYRSAALIPAIADLRLRSRIRVRPVISKDWSRGNGASVLAAAPHVRGPFFLMMCDHLVDMRFLSRLLDADDGERPCALVVDRRPERVPDVDEATKTRLAGQRIVALGKEIAQYDAVDTGVFLCRPPLFDALREAARGGQHSLSAGVQLLADRGEVAWVDSGRLRWVDVDTPTDLARAERWFGGASSLPMPFSQRRRRTEGAPFTHPRPSPGIGDAAAETGALT